MQNSSYMPYKNKIYLSEQELFCAPVQLTGDAIQAISPYLKRDIDKLEETKRVDEMFFRGLTHEVLATALQFVTLENKG